MREILLGIFIIIIFYVPFFILGQDSFVTIHDNLDSELVYLHVMKMTNQLLRFNGPDAIDNIFNGLNRSLIHSEFSIIRVLFNFFPSFTAYVINSIIIRIVGLVGVFLLFGEYYNGKNKNSVLLLLISVSFAMLPVYSLYGITVLGQPLLFWAFLNLRENKRLVVSLLLVGIFPFYVHFALIGVFSLIALSVFGLFKKEFIKHRYYWLGICLLFLFFFCANFSMIVETVSGTFISHRSVWQKEIPDLRTTIEAFKEVLLHGQYHSAKLSTFSLFLLAIYLVIIKIRARKELIYVMLIIIATCLYFVLYRYISVPLEESFHILTTFQFNRFTFLLPFFWLLVIGIAYKSSKVHPVVIWTVVIVNGFGTFNQNEEIKNNFKQLVSYSEEMPSYASFFNEPLFSAVKEYINLPQDKYRVVSIGFHPSVAQYNGFYTLDSYQNNYPLIYKNKFRKIIDQELEKDLGLKRYFDLWGNRCYLYSAELNKQCDMDCLTAPNVVINNLAINTKALSDLGGQYIFSACKILNYRAIFLREEKMFTSRLARLYLYKVVR